MQKSLLFGANVHKASIQSGHELAHLAQVDVSYSKRNLAWLVVVFYQTFVFK